MEMYRVNGDEILIEAFAQALEKEGFKRSNSHMPNRNCIISGYNVPDTEQLNRAFLVTTSDFCKQYDYATKDFNLPEDWKDALKYVKARYEHYTKKRNRKETFGPITLIVTDEEVEIEHNTVYSTEIRRKSELIEALEFITTTKILGNRIDSFQMGCTFISHIQACQMLRFLRKE